VHWASDDSKDGREKPGRLFPVRHDALVYRHWYTTLNQMFYEMSKGHEDSGLASRLAVCPLPRDVAISEEWYLAVPAHSAAPHAGLDLIKLMTLPDSELTRVRLGVGLPARSEFYERTCPSDSAPASISPYVEMNTQTIGKLVRTAFSRSSIGCYAQLSHILGFYLKKIIEIPDQEASARYLDAWTDVRPRVRSILCELQSQLDYVQRQGSYYDVGFPCRPEESRYRKCRETLEKYMQHGQIGRQR
jgi:hypothetical protein